MKTINRNLLIQRIYSAQSEKSQGRGISCVQTLLFYASCGEMDKAEAVCVNEGDKISSYPEIQKLIFLLCSEYRANLKRLSAVFGWKDPTADLPEALEYEEYDSVVLKEDYRKGDVFIPGGSGGAIVHKYTDKDFVVECFDDKGNTIGVETFSDFQFDALALPPKVLLGGK